jgi:hypothetical protein
MERQLEVARLVVQPRTSVMQIDRLTCGTGAKMIFASAREDSAPFAKLAATSNAAESMGKVLKQMIGQPKTLASAADDIVSWFNVLGIRRELEAKGVRTSWGMRSKGWQLGTPPRKRKRNDGRSPDTYNALLSRPSKSRRPSVDFLADVEQQAAKRPRKDPSRLPADVQMKKLGDGRCQFAGPFGEFITTFRELQDLCRHHQPKLSAKGDAAELFARLQEHAPKLITSLSAKKADHQPDGSANGADSPGHKHASSKKSLQFVMWANNSW